MGGVSGGVTSVTPQCQEVEGEVDREDLSDKVCLSRHHHEVRKQTVWRPGKRANRQSK